MHLIREFAPVAYDFALASWGWLGVTDQVPRFASCFGDIFLESPKGWWFLDTVEGTLELQWRSMDEMFAELESADGRAEYLLEETLHQAEGRGMTLADDEVFAFVPPPAVTGSMAVENLAPLRFAIAASLSGRIHQELRIAATPALPAAPTHTQYTPRPAAHAAPEPYTPRTWSAPTPQAPAPVTPTVAPVAPAAATLPREPYTPRPYTPPTWSTPTPQAPAPRNPAH
ncbi:T6SS immunity protein Tdi1 domain-containing protein, partial [Myceligenerans pegani]